MIEKLEISAQHTEVTPDLKKYIEKKIGSLDRFVPRHARKTVHAEVKLKESQAKNKQQCSCNVILHLPHDVLDASETTVNMFAAIDVVETKLKTQLKKYKDTHTNKKLRHKIYARLRR
jgi:putative sigma-54 modulation protein